MRYRLHTLLIVLALGPPMLAGAWVFKAPPIMASDLFESAVFALIALVGCVFGPLWIENVRTRVFQ